MRVVFRIQDIRSYLTLHKTNHPALTPQQQNMFEEQSYVEGQQVSILPVAGGHVWVYLVFARMIDDNFLLHGTTACGVWTTARQIANPSAIKQPSSCFADNVWRI